MDSETIAILLTIVILIVLIAGLNAETNKDIKKIKKIHNEVYSTQDEPVKKSSEITKGPHESNFLKYLWISIGLVLVIIYMFNGTVSPCGILQREIGKEMTQRDAEAQFGYLLFGGLLERKIDSLSPLECLGVIQKVHTMGFDKAMRTLGM